MLFYIFYKGKFIDYEIADTRKEAKRSAFNKMSKIYFGKLKMKDFRAKYQDEVVKDYGRKMR